MKKKMLLTLTMLGVLSFAVSASAADAETVKQVQQALNEAGYDCGTADGMAGEKTRAAIVDYQGDHDLEPTGEIDDALITALIGEENHATTSGTTNPSALSYESFLVDEDDFFYLSGLEQVLNDANIPFTHLECGSLISGDDGEKHPNLSTDDEDGEYHHCNADEFRTGELSDASMWFVETYGIPLFIRDDWEFIFVKEEYCETAAAAYEAYLDKAETTAEEASVEVESMAMQEQGESIYDFMQPKYSEYQKLLEESIVGLTTEPQPADGQTMVVSSESYARYIGSEIAYESQYNYLYNEAGDPVLEYDSEFGVDDILAHHTTYYYQYDETDGHLLTKVTVKDADKSYASPEDLILNYTIEKYHDNGEVSSSFECDMIYSSMSGIADYMISSKEYLPDGTEIGSFRDWYASDGDTSDTSYSLKEGQLDQNGNVTEMICKDADGNITGTYKYTYDEQGNRTESIYTDDSGKETSHFCMSYDKDGNILEEISLTENGEIKSIRRYTYNENGDLLEEQEEDSNGTVVTIRSCVYDEAGNLMEKTSFHDDGSLNTVTTYDADGKELFYKRYEDGILDTVYEYTYAPLETVLFFE